MKKLLLIPLLFISTASFAVEPSKDDWQNTTISDATIKKIQESKFVYKKCVADEMQKAPYQKQKSHPDHYFTVLARITVGWPWWLTAA